LIVIGDVHGSFKTLKALIDKLPHKNIALTGDLVDRGSMSAEVVFFVRKNGFKCVKGNHEDMMVKGFSGRYPDKLLWEQNGGLATKNSYKTVPKRLLNDDLLWMSELPLYIEYRSSEGQDFIISHSNINFVWDMQRSHPNIFENNALWSREFHRPGTEDRAFNKINIIGHTPVETVAKMGSLVLIDTGCVYGKSTGYGVLSAYDLETGIVYSQHNIDTPQN